MSAPQDRMLGVIQDPKQAEALAKIWDLINGAPLEAARALRALEQAKETITKIHTEIPEAWKKLDEEALEAEVKRAQFIEDLRAFRKDTLGELTGLADAFRNLKTALAEINDDTVLNKANRIIEIAEKLGKAKRDGTLDLLKKIA